MLGIQQKSANKQVNADEDNRMVFLAGANEEGQGVKYEVCPEGIQPRTMKARDIY